MSENTLDIGMFKFTPAMNPVREEAEISRGVVALAKLKPPWRPREMALLICSIAPACEQKTPSRAKPM